MKTPQYAFPRNYTAEAVAGMPYELHLFTQVLCAVVSNSCADTPDEAMVDLAADITGLALKKLEASDGFIRRG